MNDRLEFFCPGVPRPQGSKKPFKYLRKGAPRKGEWVRMADVRVSLVEDSKYSRPWREQVAAAAGLSVQTQGTIEAKMWRAEFAFFFPRPKSHLRANGEVKESAPNRPTTKPDVDKLTRCVNDAITDIAIGDDSAIVSAAQDEFYTRNQPGVRVVIKKAKEGNHG